MNTTALNDIIQKARENPQFFHALIFNPAQALAGMNLGADTNAITQMLTSNPQQFVATLTAPQSCNPTCSGSCDSTCGRRSCGYTCGKDSCTSTATNGCGVTIKNIIAETQDL